MKSMMSFSNDDDDSIDLADLANTRASEKEDNHNGICGSKLSLQPALIVLLRPHPLRFDVHSVRTRPH